MKGKTFAVEGIIGLLGVQAMRLGSGFQHSRIVKHGFL